MTTRRLARRPLAVRPAAFAPTLILALLLMPVLAGCVKVEPRGEVLYNSLYGINTVVIAPVMNLSTSPNVDMVEVTESLASELGHVKGLRVVPIGRVYQYLSSQEMATVGSAAEARGLAQVFGAQATIVAAITEYDPYEPPVMGVAVQMYTTGLVAAPVGSAEYDPVAASRSGVPIAVTDEASLPRDSVNRVFNGRDHEVEQLARLYAERQLADDSPYGWRRFLVDQRAFQRLCWWAVAREMLGESGRQRQRPDIIIQPERRQWPK